MIDSPESLGTYTVATCRRPIRKIDTFAGATPSYAIVGSNSEVLVRVANSTARPDLQKVAVGGASASDIEAHIGSAQRMKLSVGPLPSLACSSENLINNRIVIPRRWIAYQFHHCML
jgi:hypothetical protein